MSENMEQLLIELAQKLGTTVEHLWGVLVRQAYVEALGDGIIVIALTLFGLWLWRWAARFNERSKDDEFTEDEKENYELASFLSGVVALVSWTFLIFGRLPDLFTKLLNPEFWALQEIIKYIR